MHIGRREKKKKRRESILYAVNSTAGSLGRERGCSSA